MATVSNDADAIRQQMAQIRRELHADVRGVVVKAEAAADWHRYIKMYPWVAVGASFALGFMVVPRRRRPAEAVVHTVVKPVRPVAPVERKAKKAGLLMSAWSTLSPIAIRLAQGYAIQYLENWLLQQQQQATAATAPPRPASQPGSSGGTRMR